MRSLPSPSKMHHRPVGVYRRLCVTPACRFIVQAVLEMCAQSLLGTSSHAAASQRATVCMQHAARLYASLQRPDAPLTPDQRASAEAWLATMLAMLVKFNGFPPVAAGRVFKLTCATLAASVACGAGGAAAAAERLDTAAQQASLAGWRGFAGLLRNIPRGAIKAYKDGLSLLKAAAAGRSARRPVAEPYVPTAADAAAAAAAPAAASHGATPHPRSQAAADAAMKELLVNFPISQQLGS